MTSPIDQIRRYHAELTAIRHDIHANPELGLEEHRTADSWRGSWRNGASRCIAASAAPAWSACCAPATARRTIGLRADMDALPIVEANDFPYRSRNQGTMHACGHDGHTTMLLGAARYLAETRNFNGTVNFIFQPGEEGVGGALAMLNDDLFQRFPCNAVYGMHNRPGMPVGKYGIAPGTAMAGGGFFDITITGKGAHGARPGGVDRSGAGRLPHRHGTAVDRGAQRVAARDGGAQHHAHPVGRRLQRDPADRDTGRHGADDEARDHDAGGAGHAAHRRAAWRRRFGATAEVDFRLIFAPLVNHDDGVSMRSPMRRRNWWAMPTSTAQQAPAQASEDFAFMLEKVPGAYINLGNGDMRAGAQSSLQLQ